MRRVFAVAVAVVAGLAWVGAPASADAPRSLAEVAAKEKGKKKGKVLTEDDLRTAGRGGTVSRPAADGASSGTGTGTAAVGEKKPDGTPASPGAAASPGAPAEKPKTEEELRAEDEKAWRDKLTQAQADVNTWTAEVSRIQALVNDNTGPAYGPGRAARVDALENAKRQLAAANTAVETIQEEGRRKRFR
jgi:hypothetical protein